jgi:hypothetical protein
MAVIYLTHPVHGAKVATLDLEADHDVQNGWSRYNPDEQPEPQVDVEPIVRRGRRSKAETPQGE